MDLHDLQLHDVLDPTPDDQTATRLYIPRQDLHGHTSGLQDAVVRDLRQEDRVAACNDYMRLLDDAGPSSPMGAGWITGPGQR